MIPKQLIVAIVPQNIFQAGNRNKPHAILCQIIADAVQHHSGVWLVFQKIERQKHVVWSPFSQNGIFRLRKPPDHLESLLFSSFRQRLPMLYPVSLYRKPGENL